MKLFIVGQKWFAAELLSQCLAAGNDVVGVAAPDTGDRLALTAEAAGIPVAFYPRRLMAQSVPEGTDLILAAASHCYIPSEARDRARLGALGYHPSLLPRHRGRDAIRWALHMGEKVTGGTLYWMDDGADTGPVALQRWCHIHPDDTALSLWRRELAPMGLAMFAEALDLAAVGELPRLSQNDALATWEPAFNGGRLNGFREGS